MAARGGRGRIRIGVSSCLLGNEVRWDGGHRREPAVARLARLFALVPVCPEVELGLGTPRPPIHLERRQGAIRLLEPAGGRDLTAAMRRWARGRLAELEGLSGFVLKSRSPSCGLEGVDLWPVRPGGAPAPAGRGLFAEALRGRWPDLPVAEEEDLRDPRARRRFLEQVRAYRRGRPAPSPSPPRRRARG
jgi:uncharacterized protein YbbK (DUF523 family)